MQDVVYLDEGIEEVKEVSPIPMLAPVVDPLPVPTPPPGTDAYSTPTSKGPIPSLLPSFASPTLSPTYTPTSSIRTKSQGMEVVSPSSSSQRWMNVHLFCRRLIHECNIIFLLLCFSVCSSLPLFFFSSIFCVPYFCLCPLVLVLYKLLKMWFSICLWSKMSTALPKDCSDCCGLTWFVCEWVCAYIGFCAENENGLLGRVIFIYLFLLQLATHPVTFILCTTFTSSTWLSQFPPTH